METPKKQLIEKLCSIGAFWSYDLSSCIVPDEVLIETALRWGDVEEISALFRIFPKTLVRKVWQEKLIPDIRLQAHNYYLARIFFNIQNPQRYIKSLQKKFSRYERIRQSIT
ncbi:MAG: hypothetical protein NZ519_05025 [Bacteroidia bacterium]|nr:hypothetical protein [Bacteroidia bacterium]